MSHLARSIRVTSPEDINAESGGVPLRAVAAAGVGLPITSSPDNARYRECSPVQALAASPEIELMYLPDYSPNPNPIVRLGRSVRQQSPDAIDHRDFV